MAQLAEKSYHLFIFIQWYVSIYCLVHFCFKVTTEQLLLQF